MMWQTATVVAWRLLHCAFQATQFEKCQGDFFTVFHMQRGEGTEGGFEGVGVEEEAPCCFKAGKEANRSTIL